MKKKINITKLLSKAGATCLAVVADDFKSALKKGKIITIKLFLGDDEGFCLRLTEE